MLKLSAHGSSPESARRPAPPPDPDAGPRRRAVGRRDRRALRRDEAGGLAASDCPEGGGARGRASERDKAALSGTARGSRRAQGLPGGVLGGAPRRTEARGRKGGEDTWKRRLKPEWSARSRSRRARKPFGRSWSTRRRWRVGSAAARGSIRGRVGSTAST